MRILQPNVRLEIPAHPRFRGFEAFAAREILPRLAEMEGKRRRVVGRAKVIVIATALILLLIAALTYFDIIGWGALVAFAIVGMLMAAFAAGWPVLSFASSLGDLLLAKTCEHLGLHHTGAKPNLPLERFHAARLLPKTDKHSFEDGIESADPALPFVAAEASLIETSTDSEGHNDESTVWRGLVMEIPSPRRFEGRTLVTRARVGIGEFFEKKRETQPVEWSFSHLAQELEVRATIPSEARAVLTERVMRRLAELARRLGRDRLTLGLVDSHVLLAIESDRNRFHGGSVFDPIDPAQHLDPIVADVAQLLELAEALRDALAPRSGARTA